MTNILGKISGVEVAKLTSYSEDPFSPYNGLSNKLKKRFKLSDEEVYGDRVYLLPKFNEDSYFVVLLS